MLKKPPAPALPGDLADWLGPPLDVASLLVNPVLDLAELLEIDRRNLADLLADLNQL